MKWVLERFDGLTYSFLHADTYATPLFRPFKCKNHSVLLFPILTASVIQYCHDVEE